MSDGGIIGGDLDPDGTALARIVLNPDNYRGLTREQAETVLDKAMADMPHEDRRTLEKIRKQVRRG